MISNKTDLIKYAEEAGPGAVLSTKYNYDDDSDESGSATGTGVLKSITDPFDKDYSFQRLENGSRTLYPNNTFTDRTYDELGRLETIAHKRRNPSDGSETVLQSFTYQYDDSGNITKITEANGEYIDYNYDNLNRLTEEHRKTTAGTTIYKIEYLFDDNQAKNGNIHQVVVNDTDTTTFTYNEMNELTGITHPDTSTETLTYDNNGNLTQTVNNTTGETTTYEWDCFDRMTGVTMPSGDEINFTYDGENQMTRIEYPDMTVDLKQRNGDIIRRVAKVRFNGMETPVEKEISSYDVIVGGQILSRYNSNPVFASGSGSNSNNASRQEFYHYDHNNNLALITDRLGNIQWKTLMDAYGNVLPLPDFTTTKPTKVLLDNLLTGGAGVFYIQRAKMFNMRRRFYSNLLKRFLSRDPIFSNSIEYYYSNENPVNFSDPSGLLFISSDTINLKMLKGVSDSKGIPVIQKFMEAVEGMKGIFFSGYDAFKCNCAKKITQTQFINIVFHAEFEFTSDRNTDVSSIKPYSTNYTVIFGFYMLPADKAYIRTVFAHELGHFYDCRITASSMRHVCCDIIARSLGFDSFEPNLSNKDKYIADLKAIMAGIAKNTSDNTYVTNFQGILGTAFNKRRENFSNLFHGNRFEIYEPGEKYTSWSDAANKCRASAGWP